MSYESQHANKSLLTVRLFSEKHRAFPQGSLRYLIHLSKDRHSSRGEIPGNGLDVALVRVGRKILIDEDKFFEWLEDRHRARKRTGGAATKES